MEQTQAVTPVHQWTHTGAAVRILKCVDGNGRGYGGFQWPEGGPVTPAKWSRSPDVDSGGLFGWAWGLALGDGKEPDYREGRWIVFEAHPEDVIDVDGRGGKVKAVPNPEAGRTPTVIYFGEYHKANQLVLDGQIAWIRHAARGAASATGESGAASATGTRGAASATGTSGAASATGTSGAASATGTSGAASATGWSGAASATGWSGAASATGERAVAALTGECGSVEASATGLAVATADECWWRVVEGCVFVQRWGGGHRLVTAADLGAKTGDRVRFVKGEVAEHVRVQP